MAELYLNQKRINLAFDSAIIGALAGDPEGLVILGMLEAEGVERHPDLAINLFKCAAEGGNSQLVQSMGR